MTFIDSLQQILPKDNVLTTELDRYLFGRDASMYESIPQAIARVQTHDQILQIVQLCNQTNTPIVPRGAASGLTGGAVALDNALVLDLSAMCKIIDIDTENLVATVEPGVVIDDLNLELAKYGLFFAPDPGSSAFATVGGAIAENAGGMRAIKYGVTRDHILALTCVTGAGETINTGSYCMKSVAGYDLTRLLIGSEGTLAIITSAVVRLLPLPPIVRTMLVGFASNADALNCAQVLVRNGIIIRAMEFIDSNCLAIVRKAKPHRLLDNDWQSVLLLEEDGIHTGAVQLQLERVKELCMANKAIEIVEAQDARESADLWQVRKRISSSLFTLYPLKISEDIAVPRNRLYDAVMLTYKLAEKYQVWMGCYGHIGDGNIHVTMMIPIDDKEWHSRAEQLVDELMIEVVRMRGTITGEHGVGISKRKYLPLEVDKPALDIMRAIKKVFDPNNILNPKKIFED